MKLTLLVLAAGMGSRYGGLKQIEPVGPHDETIIDYSVYDALRAGFDKLVFVIRRDIEAAFRERIGARFEHRVHVEYVFQELDHLPIGFIFNDRVKPWGTGHAVLVAADQVREPFAVINGDDFYGMNSFRLLGDYLRSETTDYAMVGFILRNTLSEHGKVARGVCRATSDDYLESVVELTSIEAAGTVAKYTDSKGQVHPLTGSEIVSLNTWGLKPRIFAQLEREMVLFLNQRGRDEKAEFYIPTAVNNLVNTGEARVKVLRTPDSWFGVTYREDRPRVVQSIGQLIARGDYPEKLWSPV